MCQGQVLDLNVWYYDRIAKKRVESKLSFELKSPAERRRVLEKIVWHEKAGKESFLLPRPGVSAEQLDKAREYAREHLREAAISTVFWLVNPAAYANPIFHLLTGNVMIGAFSLSRTFFLPYFGRLSDIKGRKPIIVPGFLAYALISVAFVYSTSIDTLIIIRFFHGIASAMLMPVIQAYIGDIIQEGREGQRFEERQVLFPSVLK